MDLLHVHLLLNHIPVVGAVGSVFLILAGLVRRSRDITATGLLLLVVVALIGLPVFFTGEPAEKRVEGLPGVTEAIIERHEAAALQAIIALEVAGALALFALIHWRIRRQPSVTSSVLALVIAIIATVLIGRAATFGGQIRHTEIRSGSASDVGLAPSANDD